MALQDKAGMGWPEEGCHGGAELHRCTVTPPPWQQHPLLWAKLPPGTEEESCSQLL